MTVVLTIDKSRGFGTVHGDRSDTTDPMAKAYYEQDGMIFDAQGRFIEKQVLNEDQKKLYDQRMRQLQAAADGGADPDDPYAASDPNEVNLEAWLRKALKYRPDQIQKAVKQRFSVQKGSVAAIVDFLVFEAKIVPLNDVHVALRPKVEAA